MISMENNENTLPAKAGAELYPALRHPTLGNYLGAMRNWVGMQDEFDCAFAVADLHAITVRQEPAKFRRQINEMFALLLAIGMDRRRVWCSCSRRCPPTPSWPGCWPATPNSGSFPE